MINYKQAYQELNKAYKALLKERMTTASCPLLKEWILNQNRGSAEMSFTEGPERQIAYLVEQAIRLERETTVESPVFSLRPTEQCHKCGYKQITKDSPL